MALPISDSAPAARRRCRGPEPASRSACGNSFSNTADDKHILLLVMLSYIVIITVVVVVAVVIILTIIIINE